MHVHCYHHSISLTTRLYKRRHFWRSSQWIQLKFLWNRKLFLLLYNFKTIIKTIIKRPPLKTVFSKHSLINNFEKNQQTAFSGYHFISVSNYCYVKMYEDTDFKDKDTHIKTTIKPIQALFVFQIFRARGFDTFFYF